jgi:hypothetical protein
MFVLALGRRKRVGKDEFAKAWRSAFCTATYDELFSSPTNFSISDGYIEQYVKLAGFADAAKADAYNLFGWAGLQPGEFYERPENDHLREQPLPGLPGHTPRTLWIATGMFGRSIHPDYWVNRLFEDATREGAKILIIKDLRFQNEIDAIRQRAEDSFLIDVDNPRIPMPTDVADTQELALGWPDVSLSNSGFWCPASSRRYTYFR